METGGARAHQLAAHRSSTVYRLRGARRTWLRSLPHGGGWARVPLSMAVRLETS
jgi:hypothetical protein